MQNLSWILVGLSLWSFFVRALLGLLNQGELFGFYSGSFEMLAYYLLALALVVAIIGKNQQKEARTSRRK